MGIIAMSKISQNVKTQSISWLKTTITFRFIQNLHRHANKNLALCKSWGTNSWEHLNSGFNIIFKSLDILIFCHCDEIPREIS